MKNNFVGNLKKLGSKTGLQERFLVVEILNHVFVHQETIKNFFFVHEKELLELKTSQIAYSNRTAKEILKRLSFVDKKIFTVIKKRPSNMILNILRMGTLDMFIEKPPAYASVFCAVELAKITIKNKKSVGFVNGVLRSLERQGYYDENLDSSFSREKNTSDLAKYCSKVYGIKKQKEIWASFYSEQMLDITVRNVDEVEWWVKTLDGKRIGFSNTIRLSKIKEITKIQGYEEGSWWIQNYSATLPVLLLGNVRNKNIIDCCAAPGGKTMQLSSLGAITTSLDRSLSRMETLKKNMIRTGLSSKVVISDIMDFSPDKLFDAVLLDAPCSSTGTIRKNPEIEHLDPMTRISFFSEIQKNMLERVKSWVKPGGKLVFSTCSIAPDEGENIISSFLAENSNYCVEKIDIDLLALEDSLLDHIGGIRVSPDYLSEIGGVDGFYIAVLKKRVSSCTKKCEVY